MFDRIRALAAMAVAAMTHELPGSAEVVPRDVMAHALLLASPVGRRHAGTPGAFGSRAEGCSTRCRKYHHPAGTRLVRSFIRRSRGEATAYRLLYAQLTGHQYQ